MIVPRLYAILDTGCFPDSRALLAAAEEMAAGGVTLLQYRNKSGNARVMLDDARELKRLIGSRVRLIMNDRADLCVAAGFDGVHVGQDDLSVEAVRRVLDGGPIASAAKAAHQEGSVNAALKHSTPSGENRAVWGPRRCATQKQEQENSLREPERCATRRPDQEQVVSESVASAVEDAGPTQAKIGLEWGTREPRPPTDRGYWLGVSTHNPEQLAAADKTSADYLAIGPVFATSSKENPDPVVGLDGVRRARELTRKPLVAIGGITRANARSVIDAGAHAVAVISDLIREPRKSAEEFLSILG